MEPFFSVIIPLYNKQNYIEETLRSVLKQSFKDFEVIIINDGSTDNSLNKVEKIKDARIKIFSQSNQGLSAARNAAIKEAKADYIALIDADDYWFSHHLEQLYNLIIQYPHSGMYSTGYTLKKSKTVFHRAKFYDLPENFIGIVPNFFKNSLQNCITWIGAVCIPKKIFNDVGLFDSEIFSEQDTDLYIRIALKYDIALDDSSVSSVYNRTLDDNLYHFSQKKKISKLLYSYKSKEANNSDLKKYLDYNRFSNVIFFKLSSNKKLANKLIRDIDLNNLNHIQRLLIKLPNSIVQHLYFIKNKFNLKALFVFKPKA